LDVNVKNISLQYGRNVKRRKENRKIIKRINLKFYKKLIIIKKSNKETQYFRYSRKLVTNCAAQWPLLSSATTGNL
jgi:hypothetical protein